MMLDSIFASKLSTIHGHFYETTCNRAGTHPLPPEYPSLRYMESRREMSDIRISSTLLSYSK